jgi:quinol-cytochrome oxidoreductase complex cytochrome b subunit
VPDNPSQSPDSAGSKVSAETLLKKEVLSVAMTLTAVFLVAALLDAPLSAPVGSEGLTPENVKAPWIFLGVQQLLKRFSPMLAGVIIPMLFLACALALPFVPKRAQRFSGTLFLALLAGYVALTLWGFLI